MRVLVLCDDYWHPASTVREGLTPLADQGFEFDWVEDAAQWLGSEAWATEMKAYPVVIFSKSNNTSQANRDPWVTEEVEQAFLDYVRRGGGLFVVHSGTAGYTETTLLRGLMGGVFAHHPPQCEVTIAPTVEHPVNAGSARFAVMDEHYFMTLDDEKAQVYLEAASEHGVQPAGWTRTEGNGRVCVLTPGHNVDVWLHPSFQTLLANGIRWCGKAL